jgi:hypothetical protein
MFHSVQVIVTESFMGQQLVFGIANVSCFMLYVAHSRGKIKYVHSICIMCSIINLCICGVCVCVCVCVSHDYQSRRGKNKDSINYLNSIDIAQVHSK